VAPREAATVRYVSKAARIREQRKVQAPQRRKGRRSVPRPPGSAGTDRRWLYAGVVGAAGLIALILVLASVLSSGDSGTNRSAGSPPIGASEVNARLAGIPQNGLVLGKPGAKVTLNEWGDLQCPNCAQVNGAVFPDLVRQYVRPGKVLMRFNAMAFLGPDSEKAARFTLAAAQQNKLWQVADLLYINQGQENSGWVTDDLLRSIGAAIPGFDTQQALDAMDSQQVSDELAAHAQSFDAHGFQGTPSFTAGPTGGEQTPFDVSGYDIGAFRPTLDRLLQQQQ
jgi:protein-disulfide isomerase